MHDTQSESCLRVGLSIVYNWRLIRKPALRRVEYRVFLLAVYIDLDMKLQIYDRVLK